MRRITNNVEERRIAVLIDADNVSQKYIKFIFEELTKHGILTYKRIYGDWTSTRQNSWKEVLLNYSITPIQQYGYTTGKNSTDSALIIDAMDILYSENVDGFCIVSSDSDFTKLAVRLLSLIHISEPTRLGMISYAVFCLKKKKTIPKHTREAQLTLRPPTHLTATTNHRL